MRAVSAASPLLPGGQAAPPCRKTSDSDVTGTGLYTTANVSPFLSCVVLGVGKCSSDAGPAGGRSARHGSGSGVGGGGALSGALATGFGGGCTTAGGGEPHAPSTSASTADAETYRGLITFSPVARALLLGAGSRRLRACL